MLDTIFIGIDVSSRTNVVHVMDHVGNMLWPDQYMNSVPGAESLVTRLLKDSRCDKAFYRFGLEATGVYGKGVAMFLRENPKIHPSRKAVHILNPKQVKRFREAYSDLPKDDFTDAFVIADSLRFGQIAKKELVMEDKYLALQTLTRWRFQCAHELTREKIVTCKICSRSFLQWCNNTAPANNSSVTASAPRR